MSVYDLISNKPYKPSTTKSLINSNIVRHSFLWFIFSNTLTSKKDTNENDRLNLFGGFITPKIKDSISTIDML